LINLHPTSTARLGKLQLRFGARSPKETKEAIINCPHCGLPNDALTRSVPDPNGDSNKSITVSIAIPSGTKDFIEKQVTSGCRFCGLNYKTSSYHKPLFRTKRLLRR